MDHIKNISEETSFDIMVEKTSKTRVIQFNFDEWENSKSSCRYWHKELKCRHIIVLACRLEVASYVEVAYSTTITNKRKVLLKRRAVFNGKEMSNSLNQMSHTLMKRITANLCA